MKEPKLCQVLAIEKGVKSRTKSTVTAAYHKLQKKQLLNGLSKVYEPLNEQGVRYPPETQRVQVRATEVLNEVRGTLVELLDVTATKDWANCNAKADIVVDDKVLLEQVPVTYLLFLEKQLVDIKTLISEIPTLDSSEDWKFDNSVDVFKSSPVKNTRTQKVQKPVVLYPATEEHPAQTQLISEDVVVGHWTTIKSSGALLVASKRQLLERANKLLKSVKFAREEANSQNATNQNVGTVVLDYLLS